MLNSLYNNLKESVLVESIFNIHLIKYARFLLENQIITTNLTPDDITIASNNLQIFEAHNTDQRNSTLESNKIAYSIFDKFTNSIIIDSNTTSLEIKLLNNAKSGLLLHLKSNLIENNFYFRSAVLGLISIITKRLTDSELDRSNLILGGANTVDIFLGSHLNQEYPQNILYLDPLYPTDFSLAEMDGFLEREYVTPGEYFVTSSSPNYFVGQVIKLKTKKDDLPILGTINSIQ